MWRLLITIAALALVVSCGRHSPPSEATAAVVPNMPIINPSRPVTDERLTSLEKDFRRVATQTVVPYLKKERASEDQNLLDARVVRLFSKEKVLWMEVHMGQWWDELERPLQEELIARLGRLLYTLDEKAFNQSRDVILTAKDIEGNRIGDATITPFSTNVRLLP